MLRVINNAIKLYEMHTKTIIITITPAPQSMYALIVSHSLYEYPKFTGKGVGVLTVHRYYVNIDLGSTRDVCIHPEL